MSDLESTPHTGRSTAWEKRKWKKEASGAVRHELLPLKGWVFLSINAETLRESSMNCPYLNGYMEQLLSPPVRKVSFNIN